MPKLTLRDLFAVVTIVALALGLWWEDNRWRVPERPTWKRRLKRVAALCAALIVWFVARLFVGPFGATFFALFTLSVLGPPLRGFVLPLPSLRRRANGSDGDSDQPSPSK
jgi:hypothetical protein